MGQLQSIDARTSQPVGNAWDESTTAEIDAAVSAAAAAADAFAATSSDTRAALLRALADALESERETLVPLADRETALGLPRLSGELDRTTFQLRGFADVLVQGDALRVLDDKPVPGAPPAGRPRLTRVLVPIGPIAMFSASNFPFAFSVLGGDTASALAAGCPVVVKAHPAHPELSRRTAALAQRIVATQGLPAGVFQFVQGASIDTGVQLVRAVPIAAVAFTGSFNGGTALAKVAAERPRPIPFYGELGSVNPLVVLPTALPTNSAELAGVLAGSICMGSGQFCTSPGVILVPTGDAGDTLPKKRGGEMRGSIGASNNRLLSRPAVQ
jgi:NADP-dependent aldehyde dehydrogenase